MTSASDQPRPGGPSPDEAGFREWVSYRAPGLRRKAYLLCGDWHAADDLVQDALISLYTTWPRVARGNNIDAYASRVLIHKFIDEKRRPWRRQHVTATVPERTDPGAREAFESVERRDSPLAAALAALPVQQRAVLVLRYIDDLAVEDIARVLDLPAGTVKSRLSRGIDALRDLLETNGYTDDSTTSHSPSPRTEGPS